MNTSYDVIVIGGGTAGIIAGIQSVRAGARTLVVEKNGILGGTMVPGGIPFPASFHAYGKQVVAGIGWDLCCRVLAEEGKPAPDPTPSREHPTGRMGVAVNPALFAALADEALADAGADTLFHTMPAAAEYSDGAWALTLCAKTGLREYRAKALIDCTGDANVVELAGLPVRRSEELQPGTLVMKATGYDSDALDYAALQRAFDSEVAAGRLQRSDPGWGRGSIDFFLRSYGGNRIHVCGIDASTSEGKTRAEIEARKIMLRLTRFFRRQPGLENFTIAHCAPECGIRETATIVGKTSIRVDDYLAGVVYDDAVCYSFYGIDIHCAEHVDFRAIPKGVYPTIPLGALLPQNSHRLAVAGRCASGDRESHSSYRTEVTCMAMGQAAGAAAALAARNDTAIDAVPMDALRDVLRKDGAIVPGDI